MLKPYHKVTMQYSPNNQIPYISLVDGGMLELVRSFGKEIVSSANLVARFEATLTDAQMAIALQSARCVSTKSPQHSSRKLARRVRNGGTHEFEMQQWIMEAFGREDLETDDPPNVSVNAHSGDPHYEPTSATSAPIRQGDFVLLDIWAKRNEPDGVYYDITWTGVVGTPERQAARDLRDRARRARCRHSDTVQAGLRGEEENSRLGSGRGDARHSSTAKATGKYFIHRTGHSITSDIHGNGANLDNLETKDDREILPNTCFSVEPGIYLPEFGVRSEINMMIRNGKGEVTGRIQNELVLI